MLRCIRYLLVLFWVISLPMMLIACGDDDDDGGSFTPQEACENYCSCSFAQMIPNCQSTCVSGIEMATDSAACAKCTGESSCSELESNACETPCAF